jgi:glycosyltransferase involved in cell wall biosynthesis
MKIAMIGQKGIPTRFGGVERHVESLAVRLGGFGHDVTVYSRRWYAPSNPHFAPGVRVVVTPSIRTKHLDAITHTLTSTVHAIIGRADVIHYHGVGPALLAWLPRLFAPRTRVFVTFHSIDREHQKWGTFARFVLGLGERAACRFPHEVIAVSRGLQRYCLERYGCRARYLPNGVGTPDADLGRETLARFGLRPNRYLVTSGRLIPVKGIHHLIMAYRRLKREGGHRDMKLVIIGGSSYSDDYVRRLHRLAGRDEDIVFTGFQQGRALGELVSNAYAAVHPSEVEGLSISVLEAMFYGKALLVSDIPGNLEAVGRHGVTFRSGNVTDLTRQLGWLIANPHAAQVIGDGAREHVLAHNDWDEIAEMTDRLYHDELDAPSRSGILPRIVALFILGLVGLLVYLLFFDKD